MCTTTQIDVILRKYTHTTHMKIFMTNLSSGISTFFHMEHQPQPKFECAVHAGQLTVHNGCVKHTKTDLINEKYTKYQIMEITYRSI